VQNATKSVVVAAAKPKSEVAAGAANSTPSLTKTIQKKQQTENATSAKVLSKTLQTADWNQTMWKATAAVAASVTPVRNTTLSKAQPKQTANATHESPVVAKAQPVINQTHAPRAVPASTPARAKNSSKAVRAVEHAVRSLQAATTELDNATKLVRNEVQVDDVVGELDKTVADLSLKEARILDRIHQASATAAKVAAPAHASDAASAKVIAPKAFREKRAAKEHKEELVHELEQEREERDEEEMEQEQMEQESRAEETEELETEEQRELAQHDAHHKAFLQR